jgi:hypothetical protein
MLYPGRRFWAPTRRYLARTLKPFFFAPLFPVTFESTFVGDQLCSLSKLLFDVAYATCFYGSGEFLSSSLSLLGTIPALLAGASPELALSASVAQDSCRPAVRSAQWVLAFLPFALRFIQCWCLYRVERAGKHLVNMAKYTAAMLMSLCAMLYKRQLDAHMLEDPGSAAAEASATWVSALWVLLVASAVFATAFNCVWDLHMDWGLFEAQSGSAYPLRKHSMLPRPRLLFPLAALVNIVLRCTWVETLLPSSMGVTVLKSDVTVLVLSLLEVLRRSIWNVIRLDNAHVKSMRLHAKRTPTNKQY